MQNHLSDRVRVLLPLPLRGAYDYRVPGGMTVSAGDLVRVPLAAREIWGVVWGAAAGDVADHKLRPIAARSDLPGLSDGFRAFVDWVARYCYASPGAVLRMALAIPEALDPPKPVLLYRRVAEPPDVRLTPARRAVLEIAGSGEAMRAADLAAAAGVGVAVVRGLADAGVLEPISVAAGEAPPPRPAAAPATLSAEQGAAAERLIEAVRSGVFSATLLEGITGSGKTEVYFAAVAEALAQGRQALVLLPEIALSAQWLGRFRDRFGFDPVLWHSEVSRARRRSSWRAVARGAAPVVVGARSALFLPFRDLGVIVVDEEHDGSFKQEEGVVYHARDMAVVRGTLERLPVILASATPALETLANVERGRYRRLHLPERHGGATLPEIRLIDMRREGPSRGRWLAPELERAVAAALAADEQAMLFLNRRGYAPLTLCRTCGHRIECPTCSAWLVEHRLAQRLECHHCGHVEPIPTDCPACGATDSLVACGPGVERLAEEVAALFPDARLAVMASDTLRGPDSAAALVRAVQDREIDLLIGTQVMAKGHHFPLLTLVGVIDADLGLSGGDLRAGERTWQLLSQVAGRAGRGDRPGRVYLQSYMPEHPVLQALCNGDQERFLEEEMAAREARALPPFGRLAGVIVSGKDAAAAERASRALGRVAPDYEGVSVLGPAPAPLAVLRGVHRFRLLVKAERSVDVQAVIRTWLASVELPASVRVKVDIDPYSFM